MTLTTPQGFNRITPEIVGRSFGAGKPMLLIHGVGMCGDYWSNIESELAESFSLTVIDLPGHGQSPSLPQTEPALSCFTDCVAKVLSVIAEPVIVVGHSMGALMSLDLAVRYPQQVAGIAVLNGVYRRSADAQLAIDERVTELSLSVEQNKLNKDKAADNRSEHNRSNPAVTLARWFGKEPAGVNATASEACLNWLNNVDPAGYLDAYRAFANADAPLDSQLQNIVCPALFMTGSLEPNSTPAMSQHMSKLVPAAICVVVNEAKHMMSMTHGDIVSKSITGAFQTAPAERERKDDGV